MTSPSSRASIELIKYLAAKLFYIIFLVGFLAIFFLILNLSAHFYLERTKEVPSHGVFNPKLQPGSDTGIAVLKKIFNVTSVEEALERNNTAPGFEMHPGLHFMTARTMNKHYHIGLEGVRYEPGWDDKRVNEILHSEKPLIFLFGGSTMMGHGVSADETISFNLNKNLAKGRGAVAINLGSQAYDQHREIEKLLYLLRIGYRPASVIFLDGWNDLAGLSNSNMRWQDKVIFHGFTINRGQIAYTPDSRIGGVNSSKALIQNLPLYRLVNKVNVDKLLVETLKQRRDPFIDGFNFPEADWLYLNWEKNLIKNHQLLKMELLAYYRNNINFLQELSRTFDFKVSIFYQPLGLFDHANPFVHDMMRDLESYRLLSSIDGAVRAEIASGRLSMIDASEALKNIGGYRYIDVAHYSPVANMELARFIFEKM